MTSRGREWVLSLPAQLPVEQRLDEVRKQATGRSVGRHTGESPKTGAWWVQGTARRSE